MFEKLWNFFFHACKHEWETIYKINVYGDYSKMPVAFEYHLQCKKCGNIKKKRM